MRTSRDEQEQCSRTTIHIPTERRIKSTDTLIVLRDAILDPTPTDAQSNHSGFDGIGNTLSSENKTGDDGSGEDGVFSCSSAEAGNSSEERCAILQDARSTTTGAD